MSLGETATRLSVVLIAGSQRRRVQRVLVALAGQTVAAHLEVILVDLAEGEAPLSVPESLRHVYAHRPDIQRWGLARAVGVRLASADIVAFIEDHCVPSVDWAEVLLTAYEGPWAVVGYAFTNANPRTYTSRASLMARYGQFVHPVHRGPAPIVSGNNVSYRRALLLSFESELEGLLTIDFNLQEVIGKRGLPLLVEAGALAAHQNFSVLSRDGITGHWYCRLLAARRAETQRWSLGRRIVHGLGAPLGSPVIRLVRLVCSLRGRRQLWLTTAASLPLIVGWYLTDAIGESMGYLLGAGDAERQALRWELNETRDGEA